MNLLALELSSRRGSLAVLADDAVLAEGELAGEARQSRGLFQLLPDLCRRAGVDLEAVDVLVPGRGPGAYTGLRLAMTVAQAVALPGQRTVYPVGSGEALAWEIMREQDADLVAVLGDARRGQCWAGVMERAAGELRVRRPWTVASPVGTAAFIPDGAVAVSSEWSLLTARPEFEPLRSLRWIEEDRFPRARMAGELAWRRLARGVPAEPATPMYTHPPVAAAPA